MNEVQPDLVDIPPMKLTEELKVKSELLKKLYKEQEDISAKSKDINKQVSDAEYAIATLMRENSILKADVEGIGEVEYGSKMYARILADKKEMVFAELRTMGEGGMIQTKEDVNFQTFSKWVRDRQEANLPLIDGIETYIKETIKIEGV